MVFQPFTGRLTPPWVASASNLRYDGATHHRRKEPSMKLTIQQDPAIPETEVILRCPVLDPRLKSLVAHIRQYSFVLVGYQEQRGFRLPLESIYYVDSTFWKTLDMTVAMTAID